MAFMYNLGPGSDPAQQFARDHARLGHDAQFETFKPNDVVPVNEKQAENETMGTTILAATFKDGVILASDGRTSGGAVVADYTAPKITRITDHIHVCRSGSASDTQNIVDLVSKYIRMLEINMGHPPPVETAARLMQQVLFHNRGGLSAGLIIAGWDPIRGGQVYALPSGGSKSRLPYTMGGSGSIFIYGWADATWKEGMAEDECKQWLKTAIAHAKARDGSSGGNTRTCTITKDGWKGELFPWGESPFKLETDSNYQKMQATVIPHSATVADMYSS
eukprot:TRINITY_DN24634_c0_g1_i1.p2 TRINITY_DN24634_c0_g1~~TRINITY_DN24634_c0_g1_i1.p2  ORF type:complete len:277 (+),score=109.98 TRINITY_DN24634_c0_g1_i1:52-882(+)